MAESHGDAKGRRPAPTPRPMAAHGGAFRRSRRPPSLRSWCRWSIAFVALYLIVSRIALPRVGGMIDARQNAIEGDLAAAQKLKDESDAALKAYESELAAARSRAQAISNETREKLNAAAEAERKALEEKLTAKLADAEKTIAATRTRAMSNVRGIAADAAGAIVQRLAGVAPDGKTVNSAVDASLKG